MAVERSRINPEHYKHKSGLIYDADAVTLLGKYADELSAHRAKKQWVEVLNSYFLLENDRDYEIFVESNLNEQSFMLGCCFSSACGRYAFWRLINHQAPEAEERLGTTFSTRGRRLLGQVRQGEPRKASWVFSALDDQVRQNQENTGLLNRIIKLFQ